MPAVAVISLCVIGVACWFELGEGPDGAALAVVGVCTAINFLIDYMTSDKGGHTQSLVYLLGVVLLAFYVGRGPTLFNAAASALLWDYFFLPPRYTFYLTQFEDVMMFAMYFVVAIVLGQLASRVRGQLVAKLRAPKEELQLM